MNELFSIRLQALFISYFLLFSPVQRVDLSPLGEWNSIFNRQALALGGISYRTAPGFKRVGVFFKNVLLVTHGFGMAALGNNRTSEALSVVHQLKDKIDDGIQSLGRRRGRQYFLNYPVLSRAHKSALLDAAVSEQTTPLLDLTEQGLENCAIPGLGITLTELFKHYADRLKRSRKNNKTLRWFVLEDLDRLPKNLRPLDKLRDVEDLKNLINAKALLRVPWGQILEINKPFLTRVIVRVVLKKFYPGVSVAFNQRGPLTLADLRRLSKSDFVKNDEELLGPRLSEFYDFWVRRTPNDQDPLIFMLRELFDDYAEHYRSLDRVCSVEELEQALPFSGEEFVRKATSPLWRAMEYEITRGGPQTGLDLPATFTAYQKKHPLFPGGLSALYRHHHQHWNKRAGISAVEEAYQQMGFIRTPTALQDAVEKIQQGGILPLDGSNLKHFRVELIQKLRDLENAPDSKTQRQSVDAALRIVDSAQWMPSVFRRVCSSWEQQSVQSLDVILASHLSVRRFTDMLAVTSSGLMEEEPVDVPPPAARGPFVVGQSVVDREGRTGSVAAVTRSRDGTGWVVSVDFPRHKARAILTNPNSDELRAATAAETQSDGTSRSSLTVPPLAPVVSVLPAYLKNGYSHEMVLRHVFGDSGVQIALVQSSPKRGDRRWTLLLMHSDRLQWIFRMGVIYRTSPKKCAYVQSIDRNSTDFATLAKAVIFLIIDQNFQVFGIPQKLFSQFSRLMEILNSKKEVEIHSDEHGWAIIPKRLVNLAALSPKELDQFQAVLSLYKKSYFAYQLARQLGRPESFWRAYEQQMRQQLQRLDSEYQVKAAAMRRKVESFSGWIEYVYEKELGIPLAVADQLAPLGPSIDQIRSLPSTDCDAFVREMQNWMMRAETAGFLETGLRLENRPRLNNGAFALKNVKRRSWRTIAITKTMLDADDVLIRQWPSIPASVPDRITRLRGVSSDQLALLKAAIQSAIDKGHSMLSITRGAMVRVNLTWILNGSRSVTRPIFERLMEYLAGLPKEPIKKTIETRPPVPLKPSPSLAGDELQDFIRWLQGIKDAGVTVNEMQRRTGVHWRTIYGILKGQVTRRKTAESMRRILSTAG